MENKQIPEINLSQVAALLKATPHTLRSELRPLEPEIMRWRPTAERWCINEIIGHLIDTDQRAFADRIRTMIAQDGQLLESWDTNAVAIERGDAEKHVFDLIDELETLREAHVKLVLSLTPAQLTRVAVHSKGGELQVIDFLEEWPYHDRAHISQILGNVQLFLWSKMGRIKHFIDPPQ